MASNESRARMLTKEFKGHMGPCMITFSIPLMIPGLTLTLVAFDDETGFSKYGALHIVGIIVLILAVLLFLFGCAFRCTFQSVRIVPIEETMTTVTTHDKLNKNGNNIAGYANSSERRVEIKRDTEDVNHASTSTTQSGNNDVAQQHLKDRPTSTYNHVSDSNVETESNTTETYSEDHTGKGNYRGGNSRFIRDKHKNDMESSDESRREIIQLDPSVLDAQDDEYVDTDLYPLKRLPKIDLKHTKFSYSSQDKPDEEMSIIDETNGACTPPDGNFPSKHHLVDLPNPHRGVLSDGSYDNDFTSYTSTDSISGHIIRTKGESYHGMMAEKG